MGHRWTGYRWTGRAPRTMARKTAMQITMRRSLALLLILPLAACQPAALPRAAATLELSRGSAFSGQSLWRLSADDRLEIETTTPARPGKPAATSRRTQQSPAGTFARAAAYLRAHPLPPGEQKTGHDYCLDYGQDRITLSGAGATIHLESHCPDKALDRLDTALRRLMQP